MEVKEAQDQVAAFASERAWDINIPSQRGAHLVREVGRLMEHLVFMEGMTTKQPSFEMAIQIGDVFFSLIQLANRLGVDLEEQLKRAMEKDAIKYPAQETRVASLRAYSAKMRPFFEALNVSIEGPPKE